MRCFCLGAAMIVALAACDWDRFDPRGAGSVEGSGGAGGGGGIAGDGPGGSGGGGDAGGPSFTDCGSMAALGDTFDDDQLDPRWRLVDGSGQSAVNFAGGNLELVLGDDDYADADIRTRHFHDVRNTSVAVEMIQALPELVGDRTYFAWDGTSGNYLQIRLVGTQLNFIRSVEGDVITVQTLTYSPTAHRWWRLREEGGEVYWEVSSDAQSWTVVVQQDSQTLFDLSHVVTKVGVVESNLSTMGGGTATIGEIRVAGPGSGEGCPVTVLRDDFEEVEPLRQWLRSGGDTGSFGKEVGGKLVLTLDDNDDNAFREYKSSYAYSLLGSAAFVELAVPPASTEVPFFRLARASDNLQMKVKEGQLLCTFSLEGMVSTLCQPTFDAQAHRWWRMREDGGKIFWETSPDGLGWTEQGQVNNPFEPSVVDLTIGVAADGEPVTSPLPIAFDNVNVTP